MLCCSLESLRTGILPGEISSEQIRFIGRRIDLSRASQPFRLLRRYLRLNLARNRLRNLPLQLEHVGTLAIELTRPHISISRRVDQLRAHPHSAAHALN